MNSSNALSDSSTNNHKDGPLEPPQQQQNNHHHHPPPAPPSSAPTSFFVLCLTDGTIVSVEAWTGIHTSVWQTDPLVQRHLPVDHPKMESSTSTGILILPGLDGRLYYRPPPPSVATSSEAACDENAQVKETAMMISDAPSLPLLQELPITMDQLLENPVRSCQPMETMKSQNEDIEEGEDCGIVSAKTETSLLALSSLSGAVQWRSGHDGSDNNHYPNSDEHVNRQKKESVLLLQRKDHFVQYVQISNGKQLWNVSLGNYQALDFDLSTAGAAETSATPEGSEKIMIIDQGDDTPNDGPAAAASSTSSVLLLPAIVLQNEGRTLVAIHPMMDHGNGQSQKVLWRQDVPSTLANVFGIANGKWQTIPILTSASTRTTAYPESPDNTAISKTTTTTTETQQRPALEVDEYERFVWNQRWSLSSSLVEVTPPVSQKAAVQHDDTNGASLCWMDEYEQWGTCPDNDNYNNNGVQNELRQTYLTLPSGPPTTSVIVVQSDGVLLPWSIIVALIVVMIIAIFIIGRFWYLRKKAQWMIMYATSSSHNNDTISNQQFEYGASPAPTLVDETRKKSNSPSSISGDRFLQPSDRTNSNDNSNTMDGIIPLVRYSRYASEFQELRPLGKGGFGSVFQCENTLDGRQYAIKKISIYSKNHGHFQQQLHRVLREVKILAVLDHPNIVRYYTAWLEIEEGPCLVNENDATMNDDVGSTTNGILSPRKSYSSSILCTGHENDEIVWDKTKTSLRGHTDHHKANNPLGWNNGLDLSDNSSLFLSRRQSLRDFQTATDEYVIFEDSHEGDTPNKSIPLSREDMADSISQRAKLLEVITHQSQQSSNSIADETAAFINQESATAAMSRTLYIQMQLCSQKTLAEFLTDRYARSGSIASETSSLVDIPKALRIFVQISDAAAHVHECGLIHRDLKPNNCFMDDACTTVKVGDFGLSRESKVDDDLSFRDEGSVQNYSSHEDHTAGVGTRSYASPEQMNGSIYDASSDVYSLGMMLFELLYPMYTGMERQICFSRLRDHCFPDDWATHVGIGFPTIKELIMQMLSRTPSSRPTAESVSRHIQSILGEFTLVSLDEQYHLRSDISLLRVEAKNHKNILQHVMQLIQDETISGERSVEIVQYGMRSTIASADEAAAAIMEFALQDKFNSDYSLDEYMAQLVSKLLHHPEIIKARAMNKSSNK